MTWYGYLNFFLLQWTGFRLAAVIDDVTGQRTGWTVIRAVPGSGWGDHPLRTW